MQRKKREAPLPWDGGVCSFSLDAVVHVACPELGSF